jgi:glycosyltransferase involved in cell wall biosynthesis
MNSPRVSVVVPLYNKARTVSRTIDSICRQTLEDFELVVVDDGSKDDGPEQVAAYAAKDKRIRLVEQPNAGAAAARNHGVRLSTGSILAFLDADDEWEPPFLATAVKKLDEHPECGLFLSNLVAGAEKAASWEAVPQLHFREGPWRLTPEQPRKITLNVLRSFHTSSAVYRRAVFEKMGGYFDATRHATAEDTYLWLKCVLNCGIYRHTAALAWYHTEDASYSLLDWAKPQPLDCVYTHPEGLRAACPPELHDWLEDWLERHVLGVAMRQIDFGRLDNARRLVDQYPRASRRVLPYCRLRFRLAVPRFYSFLGHIRHRRWGNVMPKFATK